MSDVFEISIDRPRGMLVVVFRGFLTPAHVAAYVAAKEAALGRLGRSGNDHVTLCDFSEAVPQSQEVLGLLGRSIEDPRWASRRLAVVVATALTRLQARRIVSREEAGVFASRAEAEEWLFGPSGGPAGALAAAADAAEAADRARGGTGGRSD